LRVGGYISGAAEVAGGVAVALPTKSNFTGVYQALIFMLLVLDILNQLFILLKHPFISTNPLKI
jgi:uncharacterized membrane protein